MKKLFTTMSLVGVLLMMGTGSVLGEEVEVGRRGGGHGQRRGGGGERMRNHGRDCPHGGGMMNKSGKGCCGNPLLGMPLERLREALDLSDEQASRMESLRNEYSEKVSSDQEQAGEMWVQLREKMMAPGEVDKEEVLALQREMHALRGTIAQERISAVLALRDVLTPEQIQRLSQLREERMEQRRGRGQRKGGGPRQRRSEEQ